MDDHDAVAEAVLDRIRGEYPAISADTAVPIRLTLRQWTLILGILLTFAFATAGVYLRDQAQKAELQDQIVAMDNRWQLRLVEVTSQLNTSLVSAIGGLKDESREERDTILRAVAKMPNEYPPRSWLETIYNRDLANLQKQIDELRTELRKQ